MTVEEIRRDDDNFPAGLRVLAVDDDPICLKLLETLLRKCQYHVSTTNQAQAALKMLRENKNRFDLVISDVQMPNMDGFKLLELVGLEMDLPVIMLSANGDPKLVLKGVTHGACDYLVKPVRIEELRNIWQHVIRRRKIDVKNRNECKDRVEGDQIGRPNRKRKEEEDDSEENNGNESEDSGTQKRPRVVWSIELHRKFVAAVNQLGMEKAVPKRILDLMNVENLSRENVASHLQKYRLYLKRISSVHQANMIPSLGVKDTAFMHTGSFNEVDNFQSLSRLRLPNASLSSSFASNAMLGRLNNPTSMNLHNLAPIQHARSQNLANPIGKVRLLLPSANQNGGSLFQGMMPSPLVVDHLPLNNSPSLDFGINMDGSRIFSGVGTFSDLGVAIGGPRNLPSHNSSCKDNNAPQALAFGEFENQPSHEMGLFDTESFNPGLNQNHNNHLLPLTPPDETFGGPRNCDCSFFSSDPIELSSDIALVTSEPRRDYANRPSTLNSIVSQLGQAQNSGILGQKLNMLVNGGSGFFQNDGSGDFLVGQPRLQGGFVQQSYDSSLDELMNAMIKRAP